MRPEDSIEDCVSQGGLEDTPFTKAIRNGQVKGSPASPRGSVNGLLLEARADGRRSYHRTCLSDSKDDSAPKLEQMMMVN